MRIKRLNTIIKAVIVLPFFVSNLNAQETKSAEQFNGISAAGNMGFAYQAVARAASTQEVLASTEMEVMVDLLDGGESGTLLYREYHDALTNALGLFTLPIGQGESLSEGTFATFPEINWSGSDVHIQISLRETASDSWNTFPVEQIRAVPYALHAFSSSGGADESGWVGADGKVTFDQGRVGIGTNEPISGLTVRGTSGDPGEPLFMVTRKDGYPVFAVYEDGVYAYTDTTNSAKGIKGGFAVGGYKAKKGGELSQEYMRITADSVRFWVKENPNAKGRKGGFAVGGYQSSGKAETTAGFMQLTRENYFIGHKSGESITTGKFNSVLGYQAGQGLTTGRANTFLGYNTGVNNTEGSDNVFIGPGSGYNNTIGFGNVYMGNFAGYNNPNGQWNVFIGNRAGAQSTSGFSVYVGWNAGSEATSSSNVFVGGNSGRSVTSGGFNTFIGGSAASSLTTGEYNTVIGAEAGRVGTDYWSNVFVGTWAGDTAQGSNNVFVGESSGAFNDGDNNTFLGNQTGRNAVGFNNVYVGKGAGMNTEGSYNLLLGHAAGQSYNGDHTLIIENTNSSDPLIMGDFDSNDITLNASVNYGSATGVNNYTATINGMQGYKEGMPLYIRFQSPNTGASTININGLGARAIIKTDGSSLSASTLKGGGIHTLIFDGGSFQLLSF